MMSLEISNILSSAVPPEPLDREGLERLDLRGLFTEAERRLKDYCGNELWLVLPFAVTGSSDLRDHDRSWRDLLELQEVLGRKLVGDASPGHGEDLYWRVGENAVEAYFADLLRRHDQEMDWLVNEEWEKLREAGLISEDDFHDLTSADTEEGA
jgi:hypothetical protein